MSAYVEHYLSTVHYTKNSFATHVPFLFLGEVIDITINRPLTVTGFRYDIIHVGGRKAIEGFRYEMILVVGRKVVVGFKCKMILVVGLKVVVGF